MSFLDEFFPDLFNFQTPDEPINREFIDARKKEYGEYMEKITAQKDVEFREKGLPWLRASFLNGMVSHQMMIWQLFRQFPDKQEEIGEALRLIIIAEGLLLGGLMALDWSAHKEKQREAELKLLEDIMRNS